MPHGGNSKQRAQRRYRDTQDARAALKRAENDLDVLGYVTEQSARLVQVKLAKVTVHPNREGR